MNIFKTFQKFPTPAVNIQATENNATQNPSGSSTNSSGNLNKNTQEKLYCQTAPGTLPDSANNLSKGARALLMRLLEKDPKVRLRSLRQLQQTAFYMGFNFEHVKAKKVPLKSIFENYFSNHNHINLPLKVNLNNEQFLKFDQPVVLL